MKRPINYFSEMVERLKKMFWTLFPVVVIIRVRANSDRPRTGFEHTLELITGTVQFTQWYLLHYLLTDQSRLVHENATKSQCSVVGIYCTFHIWETYNLSWFFILHMCIQSKPFIIRSNVIKNEFIWNGPLFDPDVKQVISVLKDPKLTNHDISNVR